MAKYDPFNTRLALDRVAVNHIHSDLSAERWVFYYYDRVHALTLDVYARYNMKNPPLPDDVRHEAAQDFAKTLRVGRWEDFE